MSDEAGRAFLAHVDQLAEQHGVDFDDSDYDALMEAARSGGASAVEQLAGELADTADDADYDDEDEVDEPDTVDDLSPGQRALVADTHADVHRVEQQLGRKLLESEAEAVVASAFEQATRYGSFDADSLAKQSGVKSYGDMDRSEIDEHMARRARELAGDDPSGLPEVREDGYDLSDPQQLSEYAAHLHAGAEFETDEAGE